MVKKNVENKSLEKRKKLSIIILGIVLGIIICWFFMKNVSIFVLDIVILSLIIIAWIIYPLHKLWKK